MQVKLVERDEQERDEKEGLPGGEGAPERRLLVHKRIERWIRLQTFVYGLPEDFSYAVRLSERGGKGCESNVLVNVSWMSWFGSGLGPDRQQALAMALFETEDALSANSSRVFIHRLSRSIRGFLGFWVRGRRRRQAVVVVGEGKEVEDEGKLLAS